MSDMEATAAQNLNPAAETSTGPNPYLAEIEALATGNHPDPAKPAKPARRRGMLIGLATMLIAGTALALPTLAHDNTATAATPAATSPTTAADSATAFVDDMISIGFTDTDDIADALALGNNLCVALNAGVPATNALTAIANEIIVTNPLKAGIGFGLAEFCPAHTDAVRHAIEAGALTQ